MKSKWSLLLLLLTSVALHLPGCAKKGEAKPQRVELAIEGMTCQSCVQGITKTLKLLDGVRSVKVDLKQKSAVVECMGPKCTPERLVNAVNELGYKAKLAKATAR